MSTDTPIDKNGNAIEAGMKIRICATHADYEKPTIKLVRYLKDKLHLWDGYSAVPLENYRNGPDTNYHSVEIV